MLISRNARLSESGQSRFPLSILLVIAVLCWQGGPAAELAAGQQGNIGVQPFSVMIPVEQGFVDATSGNLHLEIPLGGSFPQRADAPFSARLVYDSHFWQSITNGGYLWNPNNTFNYGQAGQISPGWKLLTTTTAQTGSLGWTFVNLHCTFNGNTYGYDKYENFYWNAADGTSKSFPGALTIYNQNSRFCGPAPVTSTSATASDGSGYKLTVSNYYVGTVVGPSGILEGGSLNGNSYSVDANYNTVDMLDRKPVVVTSNCNGNPNLICYDVLNSQGTTSRYTLTTETINVSTNFGQTGVPEYSGTITAIQSIGLPDGTSYSFSYDAGTTPGNYGELTGITLPTGGQITYGYITFAGACASDADNRWVSARTAGGGNWTFAPSIVSSSQCSPGGTPGQQQMTLTKPNGDTTVYTFARAPSPALTEVQSYNGAASSANLLSTVTQTWNSLYNQLLSQTTTLPMPGSTSINRTTQFAYETSGNDQNVIKLSEWKYYSGNLPTTADRVISTVYSATDPSYTAYAAANILNLPTSVTTANGSGTQVAQTKYSYDSTALVSQTGSFQHDDTGHGTGYTLRGNLTQIQRWLSGSTYLTTTMTYDTTGQRRSVQDPAGNTTSFGYSDSFFDDNGANPPAPHSGAPLTNAYLTSINYPLSLAESFGYYYGTGQNESHTDFNQNTTYQHYADSLSRPTATKFPDGGSTTVTYTGQIQSDIYTTVNTSTTKHDQVVLDGLGRKSQTILVSDPEGSDTVDYAYNTLGQLASVTNPHRSSSLPTDGTTAYAYDALGRTITTTEADGSQIHVYFGASVTSNGGIGSQLCSSATYGIGYPMLSVDEAQKKRQSWTDGFGRLIEIDEPDATGTLTVPTCYTYDLLDNLIGVLQNGSRQRTFTYDALSRLTSASNPESGTATFKYDSDSSCSAPNSYSGLLVSRTDARSIRTCMQYDTLNRVTQKNYSDGTPTAAYVYDQQAPWGWNLSNYVGRLTSAGTGGTTPTANLYNYDPMGRIVYRGQCQPTNCSAATSLFAQYTYNLAGSPASLQFGVNGSWSTTISYVYDTADRPTTVTSNFVDSQHPATLFTLDSSLGYFPSGAVRKATLANGLTQSAMYNNRLQPCRLEVNSTAVYFSQCTDTVPSGNVLDFSYGYNSGTANNGNVASWSAVGNQTFSRSYAYDALNRISTMADSASSQACKGLSWIIDAWGNLTDQTVTSGSCYTLHTGGVGTNNRLPSPYQYDAAGDMTYDGTHSYAYDAENRLIKVDNGSTATYTYDAEGHRVLNTANGTNSFIYDSDGKVIADVSGTGNWNTGYVYLNGSLVAQYRDSTTYSIFADHLGSTRLITKLDKSVYDSLDFLPFGTQTAGNTGTTHKFTGKERDSESGLDNFGARYDSSSMGRFMSPDPLSGFTSNPQSLNRYSYVGNNPINLIDPTGMQGCYFEGGGGCPWATHNSHEPAAMKCNLDGAETNCSTVFNLLDKGNAAICPGACANFKYTDEGWQQWTWRRSIQMTRDCYGSLDNCRTVSVREPWYFQLETYGPASSNNNWLLFGLIPGRLPPGANGFLQAAKQATRGFPRPTPSPTTPVNVSAPEIGGEVAWENMNTVQKITWIISKTVDGVDSATSDVFLVVNPTACVNGRIRYNGQPCI